MKKKTKQTKTKSPKKKAIKPPTTDQKLDVILSSLLNLELVTKDLIGRINILETNLMLFTTQNQKLTPTYYPLQQPPSTYPCEPRMPGNIYHY
jgi:hypothetical protein